MDKVALFCKTYKGDLKIFKNLKNSIDNFNADNLPFYIVCPKADVDLFESLRTKEEKYEYKIITDEEVLKANGIGEQKQSWHSQQIIKLGFYKMGLCEFYSILDSDMYFITNFYKSNFMYDDKTPYMHAKVVNNKERDYVRSKLRSGDNERTYDFIYNTQVFSKLVLEDMEKKYLNVNKIHFDDLIAEHPFEFQWYGEWFLRCKIHPLILNFSHLKTFWSQLDYFCEKNKGSTIDDFINQGYIAILMNNGWCRSAVYKPSLFAKYYKAKNKVLAKIYARGKKNKFYKNIIRSPYLMLKELIK